MDVGAQMGIPGEAGYPRVALPTTPLSPVLGPQTAS